MVEFRAYYLTLTSARDCLLKLFKAGLDDFKELDLTKIKEKILGDAKSTQSSLDENTCLITVITPASWYRLVQPHLTRSKLLKYKPPLGLTDLDQHTNYTVIVEDSLEKADRISFSHDTPPKCIRISIRKFQIIDTTHIKPKIEIEDLTNNTMLSPDLDNLTLPASDIDKMNQMFDDNGSIKTALPSIPEDEDTKNSKNSLSLFSKFASKLSTPHFDPNNADDINVAISQLETMDNLDNHRSTRLLTLNFLQSNNLNSTAVSLTTDQLSSMTAFADAMRQRYGRKTNNLDLRQKTGENESDYISRYTRQFNLVKGLPLNTALDNTDKILLKTRIIDGLKDATIRLKIREHDPSFDELGEKIRQLRQAKESEDDCPQHQAQAIALLTEKVDSLLVKPNPDNTNENIKQECANCGRGHLTSECRTNQKGRTQNNRRLQPRYNRNYPIHGPHLFSPPHAPPRHRYLRTPFGVHSKPTHFHQGQQQQRSYPAAHPYPSTGYRPPYNGYSNPSTGYRPPHNYSNPNYSRRNPPNRPQYNSNRYHPYNGSRQNQQQERTTNSNQNRHVEPSGDKTLVY